MFTYLAQILTEVGSYGYPEEQESHMFQRVLGLCLKWMFVLKCQQYQCMHDASSCVAQTSIF